MNLAVTILQILGLVRPNLNNIPPPNPNNNNNNYQQILPDYSISYDKNNINVNRDPSPSKIISATTSKGPSLFPRTESSYSSDSFYVNFMPHAAHQVNQFNRGGGGLETAEKQQLNQANDDNYFVVGDPPKARQTPAAAYHQNFVIDPNTGAQKILGDQPVLSYTETAYDVYDAQVAGGDGVTFQDSSSSSSSNSHSDPFLSLSSPTTTTTTTTITSIENPDPTYLKPGGIKHSSESPADAYYETIRKILFGQRSSSSSEMATQKEQLSKVNNHFATFVNERAAALLMSSKKTSKNGKDNQPISEKNNEEFEQPPRIKHPKSSKTTQKKQEPSTTMLLSHKIYSHQGAVTTANNGPPRTTELDSKSIQQQQREPKANQNDYQTIQPLVPVASLQKVKETGGVAERGPFVAGTYSNVLDRYNRKNGNGRGIVGENNSYRTIEPAFVTIATGFPSLSASNNNNNKNYPTDYVTVQPPIHPFSIRVVNGNNSNNNNSNRVISPPSVGANESEAVIPVAKRDRKTGDKRDETVPAIAIIPDEQRIIGITGRDRRLPTIPRSSLPTGDRRIFGSGIDANRTIHNHSSQSSAVPSSQKVVKVLKPQVTKVVKPETKPPPIRANLAEQTLPSLQTKGLPTVNPTVQTPRPPKLLTAPGDGNSISNVPNSFQVRTQVNPGGTPTVSLPAGFRIEEEVGVRMRAEDRFNPGILSINRSSLALPTPPPSGFVNYQVGTIPPLIPRRTLFHVPNYRLVRLSPDGRFLSYMAKAGGVPNVYVLELAGSKFMRTGRDKLPKPKVVTREAPAARSDESGGRSAGGQAGVIDYKWLFDNRTIIFTRDPTGEGDVQLVTVDIGTGIIMNITEAGKGVQARLKPLTHMRPDEFVYGLNDRNPPFFDQYLYNFQTGERQLIYRNDRFDGGLAFDMFYRPRLAIESLPKYRRVKPTDESFTKPLNFDISGKLLYWLDRTNRDKAALIRTNFAEKTASVIVQSSDYADVSRVVHDESDGHPMAVEINYDRIRYVPLHKEIYEDFSYLKGIDEGEMEIKYVALDGNYWIVYFDHDTKPGTYYIYDRRRTQARRLFSDQEDLNRYVLAPMRPIQIKARDGMDLIGYLTLPIESDPGKTGRPNRPMPTVLLVHDGPHDRDQWGFSSQVQLWANRGYVVIQLNYRGSTGFGKAGESGGFGEWGSGGMQTDLVDAVEYLVQNRITDGSKVAIVGHGRYGGYTVLSGRKALEEVSPVNYLNQVKRPILIGQTKEAAAYMKPAVTDRVVVTLKAAGVPVTYVQFPAEGFDNLDNKLAFDAVSEAFLSDCLGGRAERLGNLLNSTMEIRETGGLRELMNLPALRKRRKRRR